MSVNRVILIGRLGKDPELKTRNFTVCNFPLATSKKVKGEDKTEWHSIVAFGKLAEICAQYLKKGRQCYVEGEIRYEKYQKDGQEKNITKIIANEVTFLEQAGMKKEEIEQNDKVTYEDVAKAFGGKKEDIVQYTNEDIPF